MNRSQTLNALLVLIATSFWCASSASSARLAPVVISSPTSQGSVKAIEDARYKMNISVDEVRLTFHAVDHFGRFVDDLKPNDLELFDNEAGPGAIVALQTLEKQALNTAFVIDASGSIASDLSRNRRIAVAAAKALMQNKADQGLAIGFRRVHDIYQPWTRNLNAVADGIKQVGSKPDASLDGTSLFDSLWSTCHYEFQGPKEGVQNIIVLLSDGVDTSSHATLEQAVGACQQNRTSVFVLTSTPTLSNPPIGHRTLRKLVEQTGGEVILCGRSEDEISHAVGALATEFRNGYQLFYRPQNLKRDGSFHRIVLVGPPRVAAIVAQSGYYALPK